MAQATVLRPDALVIPPLSVAALRAEGVFKDALSQGARQYRKVSGEEKTVGVAVDRYL